MATRRYNKLTMMKYLFAPAVRVDTIRFLTAIASQNEWKIFQMDVTSAFLNGYLKKDVYIEQPLGYVQKGQENKVYRLKKAVYGLSKLREHRTQGLMNTFKKWFYEKSI